MKSPIDFTLLLSGEGYAVHCSNAEEAREFVGWARTLFPKMCGQWVDSETHYYHHDETIYTFDSKDSGKWWKMCLMYGSGDVARRIGYKIIELSEIYHDIDESDASLDILFG